jgi:hypothetical protein
VTCPIDPAATPARRRSHSGVPRRLTSPGVLAVRHPSRLASPAVQSSPVRQHIAQALSSVPVLEGCQSFGAYGEVRVHLATSKLASPVPRLVANFKREITGCAVRVSFLHRGCQKLNVPAHPPNAPPSIRPAGGFRAARSCGSNILEPSKPAIDKLLPTLTTVEIFTASVTSAMSSGLCYSRASEIGRVPRA